MVQLNNGHIVLDNVLVQELFVNCEKLAWVYYAEKRCFMAAGITDSFFKTIHKTHEALLKHRNNNGDRSISVQELILDNDIDNTNRLLDYKADHAAGILSVFL